MPETEDTFSQVTAATSGPLAGDYLWSNAANWSLGVPPVDGDSVTTAVPGIDDLAALTVTSLTLSDNGMVYVTGVSLDAASVAGTSGTLLDADTFDVGTAGTVTVGTITGTGGDYAAIGAGAVFVDQSVVDPGETYVAELGGFTELTATPSSSSILQYDGAGSTFALQNPGVANTFALDTVGTQEVLELPGSSVSSVSFGPSALSITTNDGSYAFLDVDYVGLRPTTYSAAFDARTGLEAITFLGLNTFSGEIAATSGPLTGDYLWSNAANWSAGAPPIDGDSVLIIKNGIDDLAALTVASLTIISGDSVYVIGTSLDVTSLATTVDSLLEADASFVGTPVTVTVGTITGAAGNYGATGAGAVFVDRSATDPGENYYFAGAGGLTELSATPSSSSILGFGTDGRLALQNPGATNAFALNGVAPHDVLEVPGSSVSSVSFGSGSLSITTNDASYAFSNVTYGNGQLAGYSAAFDATTGLEAITLLGLDTFSQVTAVSNGPLSGTYLWSNPDNWSLGELPIDGDSVSVGTANLSFDDLAALTVASLTLSDGGFVAVTGANLNVTSVAGTSGITLEADGGFSGPAETATVTVGTVTGTRGFYGATGAGAIFVDQSAADPGETYFADYGGRTELSATPSGSSILEYFGADSTFALQNPGAANTVALTNVTPGDVLELPGSSVSNVSFGPDSLNVTTNDGTYDFSNVSYEGGAVTSYSAALDSTTGLEAITLLCFCAGSLIRTPSGEVLVEDLAIGDAVVTWSGAHRPITWIGIGQVLATRGRRNAATPVIVRKGALADNVPHADLRVTKGHSLLIDGALIPVELLVNHRSILWDDRAQEVSVYHIELASHDILIANSAPAESYRDDGNRWLFQNANSARGRMPQAPCAPVLAGGALVDQVWRRLLDRSGPRPGLVLTDDADLHLLIDGQRLDHLRRDGSIYTFCLPESTLHDDVHIASRAAAPDELGLARDPRILGIALRNMIVVAGARHRIIEAADDRLVEGFHGHEPELDIRWTNGDASLPEALFDGFDGRVDLMLQVEGFTRYIASTEHAEIAA